MKILAIALFGLLLTATAPAHSAYDDPGTFAVEEAAGKPIKVFTTDQLRTVFENVTIDTKTPWSTTDDEKIQWRGPLLLDVLQSGGLDKNSSVQIMAYDDFLSEIKLDEIRSYNPIIAIERTCTATDITNGLCKEGQDFRPIDLSERGPHFIVWPLDELPSSYVPARNSIWVFFPIAARPTPQ
ncbi:hypothetical protein [Aminobacter sp. MET-1]|uniref:hypothetical protein n=1 Tax=Aminobacter sp. MET-1 TaxID=2951085 RepID=UPI00226A8890|nr:hypothetical protein [Aminobacter sp. MET-1]MCX8571093.1 hypothetical protein [Aminobacter sp. MET-1]MCX8573238.1 hypothetical protein [Aminobacter sp. MET-1]